MTISQIVLLWFVLAIFNCFKIMQADGTNPVKIEVLCAIFFAPLYTFITFMFYYVFFRWPNGYRKT